MKPNLVITTTSFPLRGDGSEAAGSFVADFALEIARDFAVRVVAPGPVAARETWAADVEVFRYAAPGGKTLSTLLSWRPGDLRWVWRILRGGLAATRAAVDADTAAILAMWGLPGGEWARRVAHERGKRYFVWLLGSDVWSLGRVPVVRGFLARVIRQSAHAFADGYQLAQDGARIGGVPVTFLATTRKTETAATQAPAERPPYRMLYLGRWHPNKGVDLLLEALMALGDDDWRRIERFEVYGGGPLQSLVHERTDALRAAGRPVICGGYLSKPDAEAAIARCDWLVIPSRIESIPVVFSDAMKLRRAVIAAPVGDLPQLVGAAPPCGILAQAATARALQAALRSALQSSPAAFAAGVENAAAKFDLTSIARQFRHSVEEA